MHDLCRARNELLRAYPATVQEIRFHIAHPRTFRHPRWALLCGAWLYWAVGHFFTRRPRLVSLSEMEREEPIIDLTGIDGGVEYSDAYFHDNDARFVWGFVRTALGHGCAAANYVTVIGSRREGGVWVTSARDVVSGCPLTIRSRCSINACGPYADRVNSANELPTEDGDVAASGEPSSTRRRDARRW